MGAYDKPMVSTRLVVFFAWFSFALAAGCTKQEEKPYDPLGQLYLELQQKYSRSPDKNGYQIDYLIEYPNTIVVKAAYIPNSREQQTALDVARATPGFVRDIAFKKYGISVESKVEIERVKGF
jgi:hypothetical protein